MDDGLFCAEVEGALVVKLGVFVGAKDVIGACVELCWDENRMRACVVLLGAGVQMSDAYAQIEKTCSDSKAMRAASLTVVYAGNSLGKEGAV